MREQSKMRMAWLTTLLLAALAGPVVAADAGAEADGPTLPAQASLTLFDEAPQIDGTISEGEWSLATRIEGFLASGQSPWAKGLSGRMFLEPRSGYTLVGFTGERLYIAVVTELPPGQELVTKQEHDEVDKTVGDDSIELWVWDPNVATTQYQMITNSIGATFDIMHAATSSDQGWNADWEMANNIDKTNNVWVWEASVPFADFGMTGDVIGKDIGLLIARNYKRPWEQATAMPSSIGFRSPDSYGRLHLTKDAPVVRIESIGEYGGNAYGPLYDEANLKLKLSIANPGPARKARINVATRSTDMPSKGEEKVIDLPANGAAEYAFNLAPNMYHNTAAHLVTFAVTDEKGEQTWMNTGFAWTVAKGLGWKKLRDRVWQVQLGPKPESVSSVWYYPTFNRLRILIDPSYLGAEFQDPHKATVTVTGPDGKVVLTESVTWEKAPHTQWIEMPQIADGLYTVACKLDGYDDPIEDTFGRKQFPWVGNKLGITDEVLPPFEPITVKDDTVDVVLRKYQMSGLGLWKSIQARGQEHDDQYKELLAGPIALVADGDQVLEGKGKFTKQAPNRVVYEGTAEHPAVQVTTRSTIEEDGCMKVELTLAPAPGNQQQELKSLVLRIPLKDALMPLYHVSSTTLRTNPAGAMPAGTGKVWDSYNYPTGIWYQNFHPYIWLGAEARGLCWFADNDKGWVIDANEKEPEKAVPPQEIIRDPRNDTLTLKINLVQKPVVLDKEHKIVFGLMATPAKPLPKDWRALGRRGTQGMTFSMGTVFGTPATFSAKYPLNGDFSTFDYVLAARKGEAVADRDEFVQQWMERNVQEGTREQLVEMFKSLLANGLRRGSSVKSNYLSVYFDEFHTTALMMEEAQYYYSEWSGRPIPAGLTYSKKDLKLFNAGTFTGGIVDSYRDFAVYYAAEWVKRGFGCYFDNAFPIAHDDVLTTDAYELPNGRIQPSAGMWARREYLRRIWTVHQQFRDPAAPAIMNIHTTNTHIVPYMVWNEANLDLEWKVSTQPIQSKFVPDLMRAETISLQSGNIPTAFCTVRGDKKNLQISELALLVHETLSGTGVKKFPPPIDEFGYGLPDCKSTRYWDENPPLTVSDDQCKWLLLERGGKRMIVLATWNGEPSEVAIRFNEAPAGASDAESGEALQVSNGVVTVPMEGYGARIVHLN